ncbi:MAG: hypothetical protein GXX79_20795 [Actinomycetales bacterium]|nr:hypothetical protein [Actinomycetales bacterium]
MRWPWRRDEPEEVKQREEGAERIITVGKELESEAVGLDQVDVVRGWMRELTPDCDGQVYVHRSWGTLVAIADGRPPVSVTFVDGEHVWYPVPLGPVSDHEPLTWDQVERVMIHALTSPERPNWLRWVRLV